MLIRQDRGIITPAKAMDLVLGGPDMSGTSTQLADIRRYFEGKGKTAKGMLGTELSALFHADTFANFNAKHYNLEEFLMDPAVSSAEKQELVYHLAEYLQELKLASFVENGTSLFVNPRKAYAWFFEEPTHRGAGQVNRAIEQNRSQYGSFLDPIAAAVCHSVYRIDEFLRFRKILRESGINIVRSRSEESATYQVYDAEALPNGILLGDYLSLPGHEIAFANPPTHIFIVHGPYDWTEQDYLDLVKERRGERFLDDYELDVPYQLLVNRRYATYPSKNEGFLEELYEVGCSRFRVKPPEIFRFDIYNSKEEMKQQITKKLDEILQVQ